MLPLFSFSSQLFTQRISPCRCPAHTTRPGLTAPPPRPGLTARLFQPGLQLRPATPAPARGRASQLRPLGPGSRHGQYGRASLPRPANQAHTRGGASQLCPLGPASKHGYFGRASQLRLTSPAFARGRAGQPRPLAPALTNGCHTQYSTVLRPLGSLLNIPAATYSGHSTAVTQRTCPGWATAIPPARPLGSVTPAPPHGSAPPARPLGSPPPARLLATPRSSRSGRGADRISRPCWPTEVRCVRARRGGDTLVPPHFQPRCGPLAPDVAPTAYRGHAGPVRCGVFWHAAETAPWCRPGLSHTAELVRWPWCHRVSRPCWPYAV